MNQPVRRYVRTAKTYVPCLQGMKTNVQNRLAWVTRRPFDPDYSALRSLAGSRQLYLDVGANRGQSITAIRVLADRPQIVSFEPSTRLASMLRRTFGMLPDVTVEPVGLGADEGVFDLHVPSYRGYSFDGLASFDRDAAMSWLNEDRLVGFDRKKLGCQTMSCSIRRLDSFKLSPFCIKLDVQGFELQALMGGEATLRAHTPVLLIEAPGQQVADYLEQFG